MLSRVIITHPYISQLLPLGFNLDVFWSVEKKIIMINKMSSNAYKILMLSILYHVKIMYGILWSLDKDK